MYIIQLDLSEVKSNPSTEGGGGVERLQTYDSHYSLFVIQVILEQRGRISIILVDEVHPARGVFFVTPGFSTLDSAQTAALSEHNTKRSIIIM